MKKVVRFVLLPLAAVLFVLIVVAVYIAATFDPNQYKSQVVQAVKDKTQRTLRLEGDIKLSYFPNIGASLGKLSLSERGNEREFAGMDEFRVSLELMPLLSKQVIVDAVEIKNLRANLVRYKDGKTNIDDLIGKDRTDKDVKPPVSIDIDQVVIDNAAITYTDEAAGSRYVLTKLSVKSGRLANGVPGKLEVSAHVQSDRPRLNFDTALKTTLMFDLPQQHYVLNELDFSARGTAMDINDLVANAKGEIDARPGVKALTVSRLIIAATGKREGADINLKLDAPTLVITTDKVSAENLAFDLRLNKAKSKLVAKLDIPAIDGNANAFKANDFMVSLETQQNGTFIKAKLASPLTGSVDAQRLELSKVAATLNVHNSKLLKNSIDAAISGVAQIDLARENAHLTFATKVDDSSIKGRVGMAKFAPPAYTFDIDIDQLDADRYLPKPDPKQKQPEQPFDLSALKGLNADGSVRIGTLKMANVKASNVRLDVKAANDRTEVNGLAASLAQAAVETRKEEIKAQVQDQAGDRLRGWFGR